MKIERMYIPTPFVVDRKTGRVTLTERAVDFDHHQKEKEKNLAHNQEQNAQNNAEENPQLDERTLSKEPTTPHIDVVV